MNAHALNSWGRTKSPTVLETEMAQKPVSHPHTYGDDAKRYLGGPGGRMMMTLAAMSKGGPASQQKRLEDLIGRGLGVDQEAIRKLLGQGSLGQLRGGQMNEVLGRIASGMIASDAV